MGSISTNLVIIDERETFLYEKVPHDRGEAPGSREERTGRDRGRGGRQGGDYWRRDHRIRKIFTADFIGADIVRNEITAQAEAAIDIDPEVDTIFEIGGQDSKYISIDNGVIVDFEMNKACAAGTGSFLEEQAERLGISIKEEFGNLALSSKKPIKMGERCTVFIESDVVHHQQRGRKDGGPRERPFLLHCQNYLNKVVGDRNIGNRIFFQGGTAFNKGVVAAFEKVLAEGHSRCRPITM